jgi:hypothetical protein
MTKKSLASLLLTRAALVLIGKRTNPRDDSSRNKGASKNKSLAASRNAADEVTRRYLMYAIMPVWSLAGFLDWLWHRQTHIETTSGPKESMMHLLMMAEAGAPILTGLFLEMNAGALALMSAGWLLHEATVAWDVKYAISRRKIFTREQSTHGYMQTIPFNIVATMACLHPEQALSLLGLGSQRADFKLRFRKPPVPLKDFAAIVTTMGLVSGLPHVEELWRCYRAQRQGLTGRDTPECSELLYGS